MTRDTVSETDRKIVVAGTIADRQWGEVFRTIVSPLHKMPSASGMRISLTISLVPDEAPNVRSPELRLLLEQARRLGLSCTLTPRELPAPTLPNPSEGLVTGKTQQRDSEPVKSFVDPNRWYRVRGWNFAHRLDGSCAYTLCRRSVMGYFGNMEEADEFAERCPTCSSILAEGGL